MPMLQSCKREELKPSSIVTEIVSLYRGDRAVVAQVGIYPKEIVEKVLAGGEPPSRLEFARFLGRIRRGGAGRDLDGRSAKRLKITSHPMLLRRIILCEMMYTDANFFEDAVVAGFIEVTGEEMVAMKKAQSVAVTARREASRVHRLTYDRDRKRADRRPQARSGEQPFVPEPVPSEGPATRAG